MITCRRYFVNHKKKHVNGVLFFAIASFQYSYSCSNSHILSGIQIGANFENVNGAATCRSLIINLGLLMEIGMRLTILGAFEDCISNACYEAAVMFVVKGL